MRRGEPCDYDLDAVWDALVRSGARTYDVAGGEGARPEWSAVKLGDDHLLQMQIHVDVDDDGTPTGHRYEYRITPSDGVGLIADNPLLDVAAEILAEMEPDPALN